MSTHHRTPSGKFVHKTDGETRRPVDDVRSASGPDSAAGKRLDQPPPVRPLEIAVGVQPERLEASQLPLRGTAKELGARRSAPSRAALTRG
jgi:hypothetical protein